MTVAVLCWGFAVPTSAQTRPTDIEPDHCLILSPLGSGGRSPTFIDPIESQIVANGTFPSPHAGDRVDAGGGRAALRWRRFDAKSPGEFEGEALGRGYAFVEVESPTQHVMILHAQGHSMVYVNGEPRAGDPYDHGYVRLPVLLHQGTNGLLFNIGRGKLRVKLVEPDSPLFFNPDDLTTPDALKGVPSTQPVGAVLINATQSPRRIESLGLTIPALGTRKIALPTRYDGTSDAKEVPQNWLIDGASLACSLRVREPGQTYKRTFISDVDGSVQYYAINPASGDAAPEHPAMVLSLHGAAVEATNQADAYGPHDWASIVCPTNRRPYGFDWEDTGRLDALEVLADARRALRTNPSQTYLTGHSMGGHGAWQLGVTFPDRWAAIAPSAGWISFSTYGGGGASSRQSASGPATRPVVDLLRRCTSPGDTIALIHNLAPLPIYILHGVDDDNVPITQARQMAQELAKFHNNFTFFAQLGAGHWWDVSKAPGADCVDWPPMFQMFQQHRLPDVKDVTSIEFTTMSPSVSASCFWATIDAQQHALLASTVHLKCDANAHKIVGTTSNVARLLLGPLPLTGAFDLEIDGQKLACEDRPDRTIWLVNDDHGWHVSSKPSPGLKSGQRCGPFKDVFRNQMQFVYGTKGTEQENAWAIAKARFDAETWWVRGNGSVDVIPDVEFDPMSQPDRNVIVYGNADTNGACAALLRDSPVQVRRGSVTIGKHDESGDDLAVLFLRPRPGSDRACVGVIGGSGIVGMRLTNRLPYFLSGVAYPDCTVIGAEMLQRGVDGVRAAGFFGNDWSVDTGEFAFR